MTLTIHDKHLHGDPGGELREGREPSRERAAGG